jgi:ferredoxin
MDEIYERLAQYLDSFPAGYPRTESGVELRILRKLFTPQEAELFLHLNSIAETAEVIAFRADLPVEQAAQRLEEMERKGLIFGIHRPDRPVEYIAQQFVVGFWEGQVNRLDRELVELFEEYIPQFIDPELWRKAPQMRTIPVGESIPVKAGALPYESAEQIVRSHSVISVANCICRQEMRISGKGCDKPLETCLSFGVGAQQYIYTGKGRQISQEEALAILALANEASLVLQPTNSQNPTAICACCGCCCGVLRNLKVYPQPGRIISSMYQASYDPRLCSGCGDCVERCQMEALSLPNGVAELEIERCIGCGLCVSACDTDALTLIHKPEAERPVVPKDSFSAYLQFGQASGKMGKKELANLLSKSKQDRLQVKERN